MRIGSRGWWAGCLLGLAFVASVAQAADRRFVPVPKAPAQRMDVINGLPIVSAAGKGMQGGASLRGKGARQAVLMVSLRNTGAAAAVLGPQAVVASTDAAVLALREATPPPSRSIEPGQTLAMQYLVDLPKPVRGQRAELTVTVELAGERLGFVFHEVE